MSDTLEILLLLLMATTIHFSVLVFHNKNKFSMATFYKASRRIVGFLVILLAIMVILKPLLKTTSDELIVIVIVTYAVFYKYFSNDYKK
ncbi:MAG: hypothetical protein GJ680_03850 [Alteromonadaceae bacterium]|nr:hypothetical protein [Alteromonadaceae bacterium]